MGIALVIVVALAALLLFAATRPGEFRVQRSVRIQAPPGRVFANLDDFRRWTAWSPWEGLDPELQRTFSGAASGVGSVYEWQGNRKVGKGRMEITRSDTPGRLIIKLDFLKPFEAHNTAEFALDPIADAQGEATQLTWSMHGPAPFVSKLMGIFVSMDKMIGKDFEAGLAKLKSVAEGPRAGGA